MKKNSLINKQKEAYVHNTKTLISKPALFKMSEEDEGADYDTGFQHKNMTVPIYQRQLSIVSLTIPLDEEIKGPEYYRSAVQSMMSLTGNDVVNLHINSPGGRADGMTTLLEAIKNCDAKVVGVIVGNCFSAASLISMYCDEIYVGDWSHMMCHNMQHGSYGKDSDVINQIQHASNHSRRFIRDAYKGFLTDDEIDRLIDGKDFWFDAEEMKPRFQSRFDYINSLREADDNTEEEEPQD